MIKAQAADKSLLWETPSQVQSATHMQAQSPLNSGLGQRPSPSPHCLLGLSQTPVLGNRGSPHGLRLLSTPARAGQLR